MADLFLETIVSNFQKSNDFKNFSGLNLSHGFDEKKFLNIMNDGEIKRLKFIDEPIMTMNFSGGGKSEYYHNGKYTDWYSNGQIAATGNYINGKAIGRWKYWNEHGELTNEFQY